MLIYPLKMVTMYGYYCFNPHVSHHEPPLYHHILFPTLFSNIIIYQYNYITHITWKKYVFYRWPLPNVGRSGEDVRAQSKTRPVQGVRNEVRSAWRNQGAAGAGKSWGYGRKMLFNYTKDYIFIFLMNMLIYDYYLSSLWLLLLLNGELYIYMIFCCLGDSIL